VLEFLAEFLTEFLIQMLFYVVGWAVGSAVLYICSWGRIVPAANPVNRNYEYLPNGKIVVKLELVCYFGIFILIASIVIWAFLH
jgi:hypothetical protein